MVYEKVRPPSAAVHLKRMPGRGHARLRPEFIKNFTAYMLPQTFFNANHIIPLQIVQVVLWLQSA